MNGAGHISLIEGSEYIFYLMKEDDHYIGILENQFDSEQSIAVSVEFPKRLLLGSRPVSKSGSAPDLRGFKPGEVVKDPYTGKVYLVPESLATKPNAVEQGAAANP